MKNTSSPVTIKKVSGLKKFEIYNHFSRDKNLAPFKKFNLIYGWNRSVKITLSRVFSSCEKKSPYDKNKFKQYPENGELQIETSENKTVRNKNLCNLGRLLDFISGPFP